MKDKQRRKPLGRLMLVAAFILTVVAVSGAGSAGAAPPRALINGDTVSGGASSIEAQQASALGFAVDVVSGGTWDSMSQADFAQYQVLIIGDPTCSILAGSATSNAATWAPVVMGTAGGNSLAGNRILIGTDPVFHYTFGHPGALHLIHDGIAFAGALSGRTGLYFDDTCGDFSSSPSVLDTLAMLSTGSGSWSENHSPPCGGSASLIASNAAFSTVTSSDLQGWFCSIHESFPTYTSDWSPLAIATDAPTQPTCGNDVDTGARACGEAYILISGDAVVTTAPDISVTPVDQTQPVGTTATVTAHVEVAGTPVNGQAVSFTVTGQNAGAAGACVPVGCTTDVSGNVSFTYSDANGAGDDSVIAGFTSGGTHEQASAAVHWVGATEQPITAAGTSISSVEGSSFAGTVATITDPDTAATAAEYSASIDWGDGSTSTGTIAGAGGSFTVAGTHTYADEGSYTVSVSVTDLDTPTNGATATTAATVTDAALTAAGGAGGSVGQAFNGTTATFTDGNSSSTVADFTASIDWGDGSTSAGAVSASGGGYAVTGTHTYAGTGFYTITTTINDDGGSTASATMRVLVYAFAPGGGAFVVGDLSATGSVNFWGAQWSKLNSITGGAASNSFKGFALNVDTAHGTWSTDPGNSAPPPAGPLPDYMGVIVTSSTSKSGSQISGNIARIVVVHTNAGYDPNAGHAGTGTVTP